MRASRVPAAHREAKNSGVFSAAERRHDAEVRARGQMFQYKDKDDGKIKSTGPVMKLAFCGEDGGKLSMPGIEYEIGGRIQRTDAQGCMAVLNMEWLGDREAESEDRRDYIHGLLYKFLKVDDPEALKQAFGVDIWQKIVTAHCTPGEISLMPEQSDIFFQKASQLKTFIQERNFAPDEMVSARQPRHASRGFLPEGDDVKDFMDAAKDA